VKLVPELDKPNPNEPPPITWLRPTDEAVFVHDFCSPVGWCVTPRQLPWYVTGTAAALQYAVIVAPGTVCVSAAPPAPPPVTENVSVIVVAAAPFAGQVNTPPAKVPVEQAELITFTKLKPGVIPVMGKVGPVPPGTLNIQLKDAPGVNPAAGFVQLAGDITCAWTFETLCGLLIRPKAATKAIAAAGSPSFQ